MLTIEGEATARSTMTTARSSAATSSSYQQLFAVLRQLCETSMLTALDFVERSTFTDSSDPNMFHVHSSIIENDPVNPPTLSANDFWALVKERSGVDPPEWQKRACFNKLDIRRTSTISYARLKAGSALFDPGLTNDPILKRRNSSMAMQRWIDTTANDVMINLRQKLRSKHKTDSGHELFQHFARACIPASATSKSTKINFENFVRGCTTYNVKGLTRQTAKKLFASLDHLHKGHISSKEFILQGLEDGAVGDGHEISLQTHKARKAQKKQSEHKKNIRKQARSQIKKNNKRDVTPATAIDLLRDKIRSKMSASNSKLNAHRVFSHAAGMEGGHGTFFDFSTFENGFKNLGITDLDRNTLKLVFNALDIDSDGRIDYDEFAHIITLDHMDVPTLSNCYGNSTYRSVTTRSLASSRRSHTTSLPQLSTRRSQRSGAAKNNGTAETTEKSLQNTVFRRWKQMLKLFVAVDKNSKGALFKHEFG